MQPCLKCTAKAYIFMYCYVWMHDNQVENQIICVRVNIIVWILPAGLWINLVNTIKCIFPFLLCWAPPHPAQRGNSSPPFSLSQQFMFIVGDIFSFNAVWALPCWNCSLNRFSELFSVLSLETKVASGIRKNKEINVTLFLEVCDMLYLTSVCWEI